jgi:hypothetical protein
MQAITDNAWCWRTEKHHAEETKAKRDVTDICRIPLLFVSENQRIISLIQSSTAG